MRRTEEAELDVDERLAQNSRRYAEINRTHAVNFSLLVEANASQYAGPARVANIFVMGRNEFVTMIYIVNKFNFPFL